MGFVRPTELDVLQNAWMSSFLSQNVTQRASPLPLVFVFFTSFWLLNAVRVSLLSIFLISEGKVEHISHMNRDAVWSSSAGSSSAVICSKATQHTLLHMYTRNITSPISDLLIYLYLTVYKINIGLQIYNKMKYHKICQMFVQEHCSETIVTYRG